MDTCFVWATDARNVEPMVASIQTMVERWRGRSPPRIAVLASGVPMPLELAFEQWIASHHPAVASSWFNVTGVDLPPTIGHISGASYLRLMVPQLVVASRAVYLDTDMLVLGDLSPLADVDLHGHPLAAVRDEYPDSPLAKLHPTIAAAYAVPPGHPWLNSGLLVMDLPKWVGQRLDLACLDAMSKYHTLSHCADQDMVNAVFAGRWTELPTKWNHQVGGLMFGRKSTVGDVVNLCCWTGRYRSVRQCRVAHLTGGIKPWSGGVRTLGLWTYHAALWRSGWIGTPGVVRRLVGAVRVTFRPRPGFRSAAAATRP
jgi:lipopolysaccharide biosynthesis glycosyltransferase